MSGEPPINRTVAFVDGQNLFHAAREAFCYTYPNYDVAALAKQVCARQGWKLAHVRFYTGIPDAGDNPRWHSFWTHKLAAMGRRGVVVYSRPLRYRNRRVVLPDGTQHSLLTGEEKGIDVRIALDVIALAHPHSPATRNRRGINKTDWIRVDRALYDQCLDRRDYRKKRQGK